MTDIDFREIAPMRNGQPAAFEELCCQLARREESPRQFIRLRGDGGDGGIEGYVESQEGKRAWQAKYVFNPSRLVKQASHSFRTALDNHPDLSSFILCFPFDPTGRTRRGKGDVQKLEEWRRSELAYAQENGRQVDIEWWSASHLLTLILEHDPSGGMRSLFFGEQTLSEQWFQDHLDSARQTAGPRYTPEANVSTDITKWFAAFGRTEIWERSLSDLLKPLRRSLDRLDIGQPVAEDETAKTGATSLDAVWPSDSRARVVAQVTVIEKAVEALKSIRNLDKQEYLELKRSLQSSSTELRSIEAELARDLNRRHGDGVSGSPGWRQHMAEWQVSFPAEKLDSTRDVLSALDALIDWLESPSCALGFETAFVLTGVAGSGKTHGVCDIALGRAQDGLRTCLIFGHEFGGEPDPWTRISETLGLAGLGRDQLLDTLNSAGEATGRPFIVCIDAINETKPLRYWRDRLMAVLQAVRSRPFLRTCIVCRTPYLPACLPKGSELIQVEHQGFKGRERDACRIYCNHYGLKPPALIVLQPEICNPLYLRLVCETAQSRGLMGLPESWTASVPAMEDFLGEKERRFAEWHDVPPQTNIMRKTVTALVDHLVANAVPEVSWSAATDVVLECLVGLDRTQASCYLEWLVREGLLIDAPAVSQQAAESVVRPAFERLGDFLVADAILKRQAGAPLELSPWIGTLNDIEQHRGILSVLSALLPEQRDGVELPDLTDGPQTSEVLLALTMDSLPSRSESAFSDQTRVMVRRALSAEDLTFRAMASLLSIAWRPSPLDAHWLHDLLRSIPMAKRDAYWCSFLHESFVEKGVVVQLINAAYELPLDEMDSATAERWAKLLLWLTAAADRRVKDRATRASIALMAACPTILPPLVEAMLLIDDDAVRERILLAAYGSLLQTRHKDMLKVLSRALHHRYAETPSAFSNALIRDHIRAICELAAHLEVLPPGIEPEFASKAAKGGTWPLLLPSEEDIQTWSKSLRFGPEEGVSDFFTYSMSCMGRWEDGMCRADMAKWMLQAMIRDFQFTESGCVDYDQLIVHRYGHGRAKPVWAERIGKKYTWIAMYQLASRLHDNVVPKRPDWEPNPIGTPFILAERRQLDPSLPQRGDQSGAHQFYTGPRLDVMGSADDRAWISSEENVPRISQLVDGQSVGGRDWNPLVAFLSSGRPSGAQQDSPYRQIWMHAYGYLVRPSDVNLLFDKLSGRNFYGRWMPEGLSLGSDGGFAAEYPWGTPFNTTPDEWYSNLHDDDDVLRLLYPGWNDLVSEWEYDASFDNGRPSYHVPARLFFEGDDLWWDGKGGYKRSDGRTVFVNPSLGLSGSALFVDAKYLCARLPEMDRCLIWTLVGEKWVLGGSAREREKLPMKTFSQVARMDGKGEIQESKLVFFDDPNSKKGLA